MAAKRKYPKSFYDDGLGDFLEWIDDEVLIHSEKKIDKKEQSGNSGGDKPNKKRLVMKTEDKGKLYGENDVLVRKFRPSRKVKFDLEEGDDKVELDKRLEDRVRGLINRLAAQTMPFVTSEFEKLYSSNSKSSLNALLFKNIESSIINRHAMTKRKLVAELMLLMSYLSSKVTQDIGASLVHRLVFRFESLYSSCDDIEDKRLDNIISCLVNLYIIGLISANIMFGIAERICSKADFRSKSIELLLLIIKSIGFQLRKDNPLSMRKLIAMSQENSKCLKSNSEVGTRVEFMVEALSAVKNNNMSKIVNYGCDIDKDTIESTLKGLIQRAKLAEHLSDATYEEIVSSSNWYLLETRLDEKEPDLSNKKLSSSIGPKSKTDEKICKALGFSKPAEKTIFSALLRVSDCLEASNTVIGFGLNHCSDVMVVCIHVAIHEKNYNPFYFNLISTLCKFNRRYKMAAKFAIQDKIRVLSQMAVERVNVFKCLCLELIKSDAIPITILKSVEWADLSNSTRGFLVYLLESISDLPDEEKKKVMSKVDRRSSFAGAMRTFVNCFLKGCKLFQ